MRERPAVYLRVSDDEGDDTIKGQRRAVLDHLGTLGYDQDSISVYEDDSVPGTIRVTERRGGRQCIEAAQRREFDTLWVWNIRRLGRELHVTAEFEYLLRVAGVKLRSVCERFEPEEAGGAILLGLDGGVAQEDRISLLKNMAKGTDDRAHEGFWLGGKPPFGYYVVPDKKQPHRKRLVRCDLPIPGHEDWTPAAIIESIYRLTVKEKWTCVQIARYLESLGLPTYWVPGHHKYQVPQYSRWIEQRVRALIASRTFMGDYAYGHGRRNKTPKRPAPIPRDSPALVSPEDWEEAHRVMRSHRSLAKRNGKRDYLLRGLVVCGQCGRRYTGAPQVGRTLGPFYCCIGTRQPNSKGEYCRTSGPYKAEELEEYIKNRITVFLLSPCVLTDLFREQSGQAEEAIDGCQADLAKVEKAREAIQRKRRNYQRQQAEELITFEELREHLGDLKKQEATLAEQADQLKQRITALQQMDAELQEVEESLQELEDGYQPMTFADWRKWVERFVLRITVNTNGAPRQRDVSVSIDWKVDTIGNLPLRRSTGAIRRRSTTVSRRSAAASSTASCSIRPSSAGGEQRWMEPDGGAIA